MLTQLAKGAGTDWGPSLCVILQHETQQADS